MMCNYMRFGGCRCDLPDGWLEKAAVVTAAFDSFLDQFEALLNENEILRARSEGRGRAPARTGHQRRRHRPGPAGQRCQLRFRKVDHYGIYDRFNFRVPLGQRGDVFDRYMVRILEMRESIKILDQALRDIPAGPIMDPKAKLRNLRPKAGEAYGRIESPKGELGFYLISDGGPDSLALSRPPAQPHQPDRPGRYVPRPYRGGRRHHPGQR